MAIMLGVSSGNKKSSKYLSRTYKQPELLKYRYLFISFKSNLIILGVFTWIVKLGKCRNRQVK